VLFSSNVFSPEICLCAQNVLRFFLRKRIWYRIETVNFFYSDVSAEAKRLVLRIALVAVEIQARFWRHHDIVLLFGRGNPAFGSSPAHHGRVWRQSAFEDFVPADDFPAFGIPELFYSLDE